MLSIGFFSPSKQKIVLDMFLCKTEIHLINVQTTEKIDINQFDGIIVADSTGTEFRTICEFLTDTTKHVCLPIWVISNAPTIERELYLTLGATAVYPFDNVERELPLVIQNYFLLMSKETKPEYSPITLNDTNHSVVTSHGKVILLTKLEYKLFKTLFVNGSEISTYQQLVSELWNNELDRSLHFRLSNVIHKLRQKLTQHTDYSITTFRSCGYALLAPKQKLS